MNIMIYIVGVFAISCYASLSPIAKKLMPGIPSFAFISITMVFLATMSGLASLVYEKDFSLAKLPLSVWGGTFLFSLINFIGFSTYLYVISKIPVTHYQILGLVGPIVGGYISYWLLNEPMKPQYFFGLLLAGAGVFVAVRDWSGQGTP